MHLLAVEAGHRTGVDSYDQQALTNSFATDQQATASDGLLGHATAGPELVCLICSPLSRTMSSDGDEADLQDEGDLEVLTRELAEAMYFENTMADYMLQTPRYFPRSDAQIALPTSASPVTVLARAVFVRPNYLPLSEFQSIAGRT